MEVKVKKTFVQKVTYDAKLDNIEKILSQVLRKKNLMRWQIDLAKIKLKLLFHLMWYNRMANSKTELNRIKFHLASSQSMERIERDLVKFLSKKLTK